MHFEVSGRADKEAQTLVLSSGLGGSAHFWQPQMAELTDKYRVIVYDHLGTGRSPAALPKDYSIDQMADELIALLDELKVNKCHVIGHALGGLVAMQMAIERPSLLQSIVLINAWSSPNPHSLRCFNIRKSILASGQRDIYLQMQALLLYPPDWIVANIDSLNQEEAHQLAHFPDEANLLARIHALSQFDIERQLSGIHTPAFIVANKDDLLVPWQRSQHLAENLPNGKLALMEYGGHASSITVPTEFNDLLLSYLARFT